MAPNKLRYLQTTARNLIHRMGWWWLDPDDLVNQMWIEYIRKMPDQWPVQKLSKFFVAKCCRYVYGRTRNAEDVRHSNKWHEMNRVKFVPVDDARDFCISQDPDIHLVYKEACQRVQPANMDRLMRSFSGETLADIADSEGVTSMAVCLSNKRTIQQLKGIFHAA